MITSGLLVVGKVTVKSAKRPKNTSVSEPAPPSTVSDPPWPSIKSSLCVPISKSELTEPKSRTFDSTAKGSVWFFVKARVSTPTTFMVVPAYSAASDFPLMRVIPATVTTSKHSRPPNKARVSLPTPPSIKSDPPKPSMRSSPEVPRSRSDCGVPKMGVTALVARVNSPDQVLSFSTFHSRLTDRACSPAA